MDFFLIKRLLESQNKINLGKAFTLNQYFLYIKKQIISVTTGN